LDSTETGDSASCWGGAALKLASHLKASRTSEDSAGVLNAVKAGKGAYGYIAATGEHGDMLKAGTLHLTKVTRLALQNAASVAGLLLTTEVMIADAPKDEAEHAHGPGGGMGGMGGMDM